MATKEAIRKRIKDARKNLSKAEVEQKSKTICERIETKEWYQNLSGVLCVYSAISNEVLLDTLIQKALEKNQKLAFPRVKGKEMDFYLVSSFEELEVGAFHILEPKDCCKKYLPEKGDVMLVPGVAFSEKGSRIGFGQGYYDRYLKRFPEVYPVGIAYEMQIVKDWGKEEFDVPMVEIITEQREVMSYDREYEFRRIM